MTNINDFKLNQGIIPVQQNRGNLNEVSRKNETGASFETLLQEQLNKNGQAQGVQFSKHAQERVDQRGISLTESLLSDLNQAVEKARAKGARDVVIFDAKQAFIVNVPNNTVVTTISGNEMKNNVFTNIDSAVIL